MSKFKVGDKVVVPKKFGNQVLTIERVHNFPDPLSYTKSNKNMKNFYTFKEMLSIVSENLLIGEEIYNSSLYKIMEENEDI